MASHGEPRADGAFPVRYPRRRCPQTNSLSDGFRRLFECVEPHDALEDIATTTSLTDTDCGLKLDRTDVDIAEDAVRALELRSTIPDSVQAVVHSAHVTLTGNVNWLFQKRDAEDAVRHIRGVQNVVKYIAVAPQAAVCDVRSRIVQALHQDADVDARHITVPVSGDTARLTARTGPGCSASRPSEQLRMRRVLVRWRIES